jgi:hypothetical protein
MTSPWPCAAVSKDITTALGADIDAANCKYCSSTFGRKQTRLGPRRTRYDSVSDTDSQQHHGHLSLPRRRRANLNRYQQLNDRLASDAVRENSALIVDNIDVYEMPDAPDQRRVGVK